jgi:ferrous-iron efflux pump FieF
VTDPASPPPPDTRRDGAPSPQATVDAPDERSAAEAARRIRLRRWATAASVGVASTLALAKLGAWLVTGSVTILSSLLDSLVDVAASTITFFAVRHALRPPDRAHRFGHGKAEPLGALAQAAFIVGSALFLVFEAIGRLVDPEPLSQTGWGIAVMVLALVLTGSLVVFQRYVVKVTGSLAIGADSLQYKGDLLVAVAVIATLLVVTGDRFLWLDAVVGMAIAGYLVFNAWRIAGGALDVLMDKELPVDDRERIRKIVTAHDGVEGMHDLRTRHSGVQPFIELHLELDGDQSLESAHAITDTVERALKHAFPGAEVVLHQEPAGLDDERLDDRIRRDGNG